ncbi:unnamed protein product [Alopecurus aequalis]
MAAASPQRKDPYEVLRVRRDATDEEIRSAYRRMALKYHPDKNADDPFSSGMFLDVAFAYSILSDPNKRRRYDTGTPEPEPEPTEEEWEVDLSTLNTVQTMLGAILIMLGDPIKTAVSEPVLEQASNGSAVVSRLRLGNYVCRKVEKQAAHFYSVDITEQEAKKGLVCRVHSTERSKFKEDSVKAGKVTSAGMYFLGFPVCRFAKNNWAAAAKNPFPFEKDGISLDTAMDPDTSGFKRLDSFRPCDGVNELKPGTHFFAVYGDDFFRSSSYTIEIVGGESFPAGKAKLRSVEAKILRKRAEMSKFEAEYREVLAKFVEMPWKYRQQMRMIDKLLDERNAIHASYTNIPPHVPTSMEEIWTRLGLDRMFGFVHGEDGADPSMRV